MSPPSKLTWIFYILLILRFCNTTLSLTCESNEIACGNNYRCISLHWICDGGSDCGDQSDEMNCEQWKTQLCGSSDAFCNSGGLFSCIPLTEYCKRETHRCNPTVDPRICQVIRNGRLQRLEDVVLPTEPIPTQPTTAPPLDNVLKSETKGRMLEDTFNTTLSHPECPKPYTRVGHHCLSLLHIIRVGWGEARAFCRAIDGKLLSLVDEEDFISLTKHLRDNEMTADFWVGGRFKTDTESWTWLTGSPMELGSPFWAVRYNNVCLQRRGVIDMSYWFNKTACFHYEQAPQNATTDLCAAITYKHYYYMTDEDCMTAKSPLCVFQKSLKSVN